MKLKQRLLGMIGIVVLAMGLAPGIALAETSGSGTGSFEVAPPPEACEDQSLGIEVTGGALDFGMVLPSGNGVVPSHPANPLEVEVTAGCGATAPWTVGITVGNFNPGLEGVDPVSASRLTLNANTISYTVSPGFLSVMSGAWGQGCELPEPNWQTVLQPEQGTSIGFTPATGVANKSLLMANGEFFCRNDQEDPAQPGAPGITTASWDAELDLTGVELTVGATYESQMVITLSPVVDGGEG